MWTQFIEDTQTDSHYNWVKNDDTFVDDEIPKPNPSLKHFLKIVQNKLKCMPTRVAQDKCYDCAQLLIFSKDTEDEKQRIQIQQCINETLTPNT